MTKKEPQSDIDVELVTKATAEVELQVLRDLQTKDKAMASLLDCTVFDDEKEKETDEDKNSQPE